MYETKERKYGVAPQNRAEGEMDKTDETQVGFHPHKKPRFDEYLQVEKNIRFARFHLIDIICKEASLEGLSVTRAQVEEIGTHQHCLELSSDDILKIKNLFKAWEFVFETAGYSVDLRYVRQMNWEVGKGVVHQAGELRTADVAMGGTGWKPELPDMDKAQARIAAIRDSGGLAEDRAIDMMLYIMRAQMFADGNKRTAQLIANQMLISDARGILLAVPVERIDDFLRLLVCYYETNTPDEIKIFLRRHCLLG